jgi:hypothetical protein
MITRIFDSHDTGLHSTWHLDNGGIVSLIVPDVGEIRMSLAKAEDLAISIARHVMYGRAANEVKNG